MKPADSTLHDDLSSTSADATYRAMSFIARHDGPEIVGPADDFANLVAHRAGMLAWLQSRHDRATLENEYLEYRERWSPVFKD